MVFLPPESTSQSSSSTNLTEDSTASHSASEGKYQILTTTQDQMRHASEVVGAHHSESGYSYHYTPQSMILVQVNPGETFTIQAENHTQCITGPAQVPMVSPNGAIPPIQVPHGYISQVIEDQQGFRKVVVIPEPSSQFAVGPGSQAMASQPPHGMPQPGPHLSFMHQMNAMPLNQQRAMTFPAGGDHLAMFHTQPIYTPSDRFAGIDTNQQPTLLQQYQYPPSCTNMDNGRVGKVKDRLQRKLREKHHNISDSNQNPSPTSMSSFSPSSSSSSYAPTPSPNSSPDSSPRIISNSSAISKHQNVFQMKSQTYPLPHSLNSPQASFPSSSHSPSNMPSIDGFKTAQNYQPNSPKTNTSDEAILGISTSGSPRWDQIISQEIIQHYSSAPSQCDAAFHSNVAEEPFPLEDGKWTLKGYLSAITKPEVYDVQPRNVYLKWSMRYSPPEGLEVPKQSIAFEIYVKHIAKDGNKFKLTKRQFNTFAEIKDLKPGVEYYAKVLAERNSVKGSFSEVAKFRTKSCQPDTPGAPKMAQCSKNSITLRWNAPNDNGEKILQYHLEWDEGEKGSGFRSLFLDKQKHCFYKVNKLKPSHYYTFRLNCRNKVGESPWSPEVTHRTGGTAPSVPNPPRLSKAFVRSLVITWSNPTSGGSDSGYGTRFSLEMDDGMGYGFKPVYYGPELQTQIKNLNRRTMYKFRLRANNNEGKSAYSVIESFLTLPDKPGPPGKVTLKGKAHPTWFKVSWDPPQENGGSEISEYILECTYEKGQPLETVYSGVETEYIFNNLQPGQTCRLRVYCVSNGGTSASSEMADVTTPPVVPGQCAPPRAASKPKPTILSLQWDAPNYDGGSTVTEYELVMDKDVNLETENSMKQIYCGPALEYSVGGLKCDTNYKFLLRAANKVGMGQWSDLLELETSPGPPEKPDTPEAVTVNSGCVLLTWKKPHDNGSEITAYSAEWGSENSTMIVQPVGSLLSYDFQGLSPDTTYFFRIQAHNFAGKGPFSTVASVKTMASCPNCIDKVWQGDILPIADYIEELGMEEDDVDGKAFPKPSTSAMICWAAPAANGSEILGYILEVTPVKSRKKKPTSEEEPFLIDIDGEEYCHLLQNLIPDSEYRIRVKAENEIGSGPFSQPITIETQPLPPDPPMIECTCSYNSLKLKWEDADSNNFYLLQMKDKHGRFVTIHSSSGRTYKVNRLMEKITYHFRVNARNNAGEGPFSSVYSFTTTAAPPPQLKNPLSVSVQEGNAEISWDDADTIKGDAVSYLLNIESYDDSSMKQTVSLAENRYRISSLIPGRKYRVQVAVVRQVNPGALSKTQDTTAQLEGEDFMDSLSKSTTQLEDGLHQETVVGQFSNWFTFESPICYSVDAGSSFKVVAERLETSPTTLADILNRTWASMCDETIAPVLLTVSFFVLAVFVAFVAQIMRV